MSQLQTYQCFSFFETKYGTFIPISICKSSIKLYCEATNQYFFLAKTTPMHATNSYSLEHSSINNSIYTSSVQLNAHLHSEPTNQVRLRVSMCNRVQKHYICVAGYVCESKVREGCVMHPYHAFNTKRMHFIFYYYY